MKTAGGAVSQSAQIGLEKKFALVLQECRAFVRYQRGFQVLFKLPTLVLGLALGATAQAAPSAETEAVYQRAKQMALANEHWIDRLVEQEKNGQLDKQIMIEAMADLQGKLAVFEAGTVRFFVCGPVTACR
ncbi:hypothetical protein [Pseudomonas sp. TWI628]|uniref:hypothetical protein n=1 Tax=Pseudomonas sp. TWI628 TaxID=3136788 RepID=UPI0032098F24